MELKQIKELMTAMGRTGTKRLTLKREDFELSIERGEEGFYRTSDSLDLNEESFHQQEAVRRAMTALSKAKDSASSLPGLSSLNKESLPESVNNLYITSPMVGTFYGNPTPGEPSFVKVGDKIEKSTVVCIIEAMKVMNEIKAGIVGTIVEALIDNGSPVEFGTKLYRII